jgi:hypothetical protein
MQTPGIKVGLGNKVVRINQSNLGHEEEAHTALPGEGTTEAPEK